MRFGILIKHVHVISDITLRNQLHDNRLQLLKTTFFRIKQMINKVEWEDFKLKVWHELCLTIELSANFNSSNKYRKPGSFILSKEDVLYIRKLNTYSNKIQYILIKP